MKPEIKKPFEVLSLYPKHDDTLPGLLESRRQGSPQRPFLYFRDKIWSWEEFHEATVRTARMLTAHGIGKGDRLVVMSPNTDVHIVLFFALARLGAILVPINPNFGMMEASYVLNHSGPSAVVLTPEALPTATRACEGMPKTPRFIVLEGRADSAPSFADLLDEAPDGDLPNNISAEDTCLIIYTSGTTGFPKGVMHSQRNFVIAGEGFVKRMYLQPQDRLLCVLPLFHLNALFYSLGGAMAAGASVILAPRFSASGFWQLAASTGATEVNIIAAIGNILARRPRSEFVPGHRIAKIYGAPLSQDIVDIFRNEFSVQVLIEGYGMTEIPGVTSNPIDGRQKIGSMGPALHSSHGRPFAEMRVVDGVGQDVADNQIGELLVRTPIVMQGYYRDPEQTAAAFRDGWFLTGDLVRRDAEGYYFFVGRKKDIIRRRGENISGAELDRIIGQHPGIAEVAAIAVDSELGEDDILVALVAKPDAAPTAAEIAAWCAEQLAPVKIPRYILFVDELPHTPTHRVAKFKLKDDPTLRPRAVDLQAPEPHGRVIPPHNQLNRRQTDG